MLDADWHVREADGVTLVAAVLENATPTAREVRLVSRLDGPVLPPRRRGVPEAGWSDRGFEGVVPPEGRLALGFAYPGDPAEPPVDVVDAGRVSGGATGDGGAGGENLPTPTDLVRTLGSPAPPCDAVPTAVAGSEGTAADATGPPDGTELPDEFSIPATVADWFDEVAERIERAERLAAVRDPDAASAASEAPGGHGGIEDFLSKLAGDEPALRAVARRATELADECAVHGNVPTDSRRERT